MSLTHRSLLIATLAVGACFAADAPKTARIKIDPERKIATVDPRVFGNFAEHLGRCIYGGIYEPGSPLADDKGYRKDVMEATKNLGVSQVRWPGGNFVSGYHWEDAIGPKDKRPVRRDNAWGAYESNQFGTDEFLQWCERVGAEPYICVNAGLGTIDEARHWVEYTNEAGHTYYSDLRRANGHDKPYGVKIWGIGNEIDGPWQLGHRTAEDYARFALEAAKAMRRADDSIQLIASGSSYFGGNGNWIHWNRTVLEALKNEIDYISLHTYINNHENNFEKFLSSNIDMERRIEVVEGLIKAARETQSTRRPIYIAFDEWNVWYRTVPDGGEYAIGRTGLEEQYNAEDALAMGMFLNTFFRHAGSVRLANLAQLVNVIAPIFTDKKGLFLQTIYWPIQEYGKQRNNVALDALVDSPTYEFRGEPAKYLDVSVTHDTKSGRIFVNVLNRSAKNDIATRIDVVDAKVASQVDVWQMNNADFKAVNTMSNDKTVRPVTKQIAGDAAHNAVNYAFPAHSLTILSWKAN